MIKSEGTVELGGKNEKWKASMRTYASRGIRFKGWIGQVIPSIIEFLLYIYLNGNIKIQSSDQRL